MVINVWMAVVIAVIAMFLGIWIGRNTEGMAKETELMASTGMSNQDEKQPGQNFVIIPLGFFAEL